MHKSNLQAHKYDIKQLRSLRDTTEMLRLRRRELMFRLHRDGMSQEKIAQIYGCKQPFVAQEIAAYKAHDVMVAA